MDVFEGEDMQTQYSVLKYRINLYFHRYKLAVEVDEKGHKDRYIKNEIERQEEIKEKLNCVFLRINPDEQNFNIFKVINEIYRQIKKSNKILIKEKKSLINKVERRLLELEFESNNSKKTRCLRYIVKKNISHNTKKSKLIV